MDVSIPASIDLSIESVSVEGLGDLDRAAIGPLLENELTRLVESGGVPGSWSQPREIRDLVVDLDWDGRDGAVGLATALAVALYGRFGS